jgi:hypothetical protein
MRLVVDARDRYLPAEVSVDRLRELLAHRENRLWLDIADPGPAEVEREAPVSLPPSRRVSGLILAVSGRSSRR